MFQFINTLLWQWRFKREMRKTITDLRKHPEKYIDIDDGKEPTEEMILDYYEIYLKKKKRDSLNEWTTESPMTIDEYRSRSKECGKHFLFGSVATMITTNPDGTTVYM